VFLGLKFPLVHYMSFEFVTCPKQSLPVQTSGVQVSSLAKDIWVGR